MAQAFGFNRAERCDWRLDLALSLVRAEAGGGGFKEREAEFRLAAAALRVNRWPVGGVAAGDVDSDDAGGEGEPPAGATD